MLTEHNWWLTALPTTGTATTRNILDTLQRRLTRGGKWLGSMADHPVPADSPPTPHIMCLHRGLLGVAPLPHAIVL